MGNYSINDTFEKIGKNLGDVIGASSTTKPHQDDVNARTGLGQATDAYKGIAAPKLQTVAPQSVGTQQAQTTQAGPTAYNGISTNPAYNEAQSAQMAALSSLAKNGGRNAASDANLAQIQQNENANAQGQRGAIMQNARARGMGSSGNSLLAQLSSSQNATNNQSAQDMTVRGQDQNTMIQAGQGAAAIGANMEAQQYGEQAQKAAAADAISRFNAGNSSQTSQFNAGQGNQVAESNAGRAMQGDEYNSGLGQTQFADSMGIAAGNQGGGKLSDDYWSNKYKEDQAANGGMAGGAMKGIGAIASFAAHGGRVPGMAEVRGDSYANDKVPVTTSPGEVIVPRSIAHSGDSSKIASFVKNPPPIPGSKDKEAMLGALKNLRSRR